MTQALRQPSGPDATAWPTGATLILRNRTLRTTPVPRERSRFADPVWHLTPAHPDAHLRVAPLRWRRYPAGLVPAFKAFFLAALDHPYPPGPGVQRPGERPSVATLEYWFHDLLVFAGWLDERGIGRLDAVLDADLDAYRGHVLALPRSPARKVDILTAVRTLWLFHPYLPAPARLTGYPWRGTPGTALVAAARTGAENKTPRIDPATMDALLGWALRMVEDIGPDIAGAWREYRLLERGEHPSQAGLSGTLGQRLPAFLERARRDGTPLPGKPDTGGGVTVNYGHLVRLTGLPQRQRAGLTTPQKQLIERSGLPVADDARLGTIAGRIDGRPWRPTRLTVRELPTLVRLLVAAAFVVVCYLSGMRPGEVLNLPRGCRDTDPQTGELLIRGRRGKGFDRVPAADRAEPHRPWVVVKPVHDAIRLLEDLGEDSLLFPADMVVAHARSCGSARSAAAVNRDLQDFLTWVNRTFHQPGGAAPIPPDPTKHLHGSRLRRTLAYHIVRRPRGLIAAALQYGHVSTKVTLSYAGRADTTWTDDLTIERLDMILDQLEHDAALLDRAEHVSGPAAAEYRARLARSARFTGRTVTGLRNASRLLAHIDPDIHHAEAMTCVWRAETAACRQANLADGLPAGDAPDAANCRSACPNLAYTDRDITEQQAHLARWRAEAADLMAPQPLRDRAAALADRAGAVIARHETSRFGVIGPTRER